MQRLSTLENGAMALIDFAMVRGLERAEALHLQRQVEICRLLRPELAARTIEIAGGVAALTAQRFGRKLNHVTGFGMGGAPIADELVALEAAYGALDLPTEIDLCPYADPSAVALLGQRGYTLNAFSNTYVCQLDRDYAQTHSPSGVSVMQVSPEHAELYVDHCVAGFSVQLQQRPVELLELLARIALQRADTRLFIATVDGQVAGTAGVALLEEGGFRLAHLYIASTLPAFRGRGVQQALLSARLQAAREAGYTLAGTTVRPNNVSARNAQRAGFGLAYTKVTLARGM